MTESAIRIGYPEWTEYRKKNGLDPLGMQTSSVWLYQRLLPGISNVTLRMRYYGYYAWLSSTYAKRVRHTDPTSWQRWVRRAEALYALIAQRHTGETGVAGVTWAAKALANAVDGTVEFASAAEPGGETRYLKQAWGAYGAAYGSQLFEVGILMAVSGHQIPVPSPALGDPIAGAFEAAVGELAERAADAIEEGSISLGDLDDLAPMRPSEISAVSGERQWYESVLFDATPTASESARQRRRTLMLVLQCISQLKRVPTVAELRWVLYAGRTASGTSVEWGSIESTEQRDLWWAYQANDLTHIAYEALLKFSLDLLEPYTDGISLQRLLSEVISQVQSSAGAGLATWGDFLAQNSAVDPQAEEVLCDELIKATRADRLCPPSAALLALKLLALVQDRVRGASRQPQAAFHTLDQAVVRSLATEIDFLEKHRTTAFPALLGKMVEERILRRHLWIALRKLRYQEDYTFLIEADDGRIRLRTKDGPVFTNPRLGSALTFLKDIHLIDKEGLTSRGKQILGAA